MLGGGEYGDHHQDVGTSPRHRARPSFRGRPFSLCGTDEPEHPAAVKWSRGLDEERVWAIEDCRQVSRRLEQALAGSRRAGRARGPAADEWPPGAGSVSQANPMRSTRSRSPARSSRTGSRPTALPALRWVATTRRPGVPRSAGGTWVCGAWRSAALGRRAPAAWPAGRPRGRSLLQTSRRAMSALSRQRES